MWAGLALRITSARPPGWATRRRRRYSRCRERGPVNPTLELFAAYLIRVAPGLLLGGLMLLLARRDARLRVVVYLALFVLLRDAMTPLGLWSFGAQGLFWMRLHSDPAL